MSLQKLSLCIFLILAFASLGLAQQRDLLPVPDVAGYRTLKCDFHMHTVFSDGQVWPTTRVTEAWTEGLDAIAIADHDDYHPHKGDVGVDLSRPFAIAQPLARELGLLLVPAVEITKGEFHFNALFVKDFNAFTGLPIPEALRKAREQNAFVFWNHPGWKRPAEWWPEVAGPHADGNVHGVELVNGGTFYDVAFPWIKEKNLAILSNTDVHAPLHLPDGERHRPMTLVFAKTADLDGIREALTAHRTAAWRGADIWGAEELLRGLWSGAVTVADANFAPGAARGSILLRNTSAIPFHITVRNSPSWMKIRSGRLPGESASGLAVQLDKTAPAGRQRVEIELELANLHTAPGSNLRVKVPLNVNR